MCLYEITTRDNFPTVEGPLGRATLPLLQAPLSSMALLSDSRLLYGTNCGKVKLHNFSGSDSSELQPHCSRVTCITVSNWGMYALVGSQDATQRLWALDSLALDHTMEYEVRSEGFTLKQRRSLRFFFHQEVLLCCPDQGWVFEGVLCAAFSDSDRFVFTGSQDRTVKVWEVASGETASEHDCFLQNLQHNQMIRFTSGSPTIPSICSSILLLCNIFILLLLPSLGSEPVQCPYPIRFSGCDASMFLSIRETSLRSVRLLPRRPPGDLQEWFCGPHPSGIRHPGGLQVSGPHRPRLQAPEEHPGPVPGHLQGEEHGRSAVQCFQPTGLQPGPDQPKSHEHDQNQALLLLCPPVGHQDPKRGCWGFCWCQI